MRRICWLVSAFACLLLASSVWGEAKVEVLQTTSHVIDDKLYTFRVEKCYLGGFDLSDILKAEELASMAFPDRKAVYYLGRIHHPNSSILDFGKPKLSKRAAKKKDDIQKIRFCDCQNVYEYLLALEDGKTSHAENYEKMIRGHWMEKWRLKGPDINLEAQNQFKTLVQAWMKEKLC